jgi:putative endonuclease
MKFYVYILFSVSTDKFYIGQTNNLSDRINRHNSSCGAYTSFGKPWILIWSDKKDERAQAIALEKKLKNLSKHRIVRFIAKYKDGINDLNQFNVIQSKYSKQA